MIAHSFRHVPKILAQVDMEKLVMSLSSWQFRVFLRFLDTTIPCFSAAEKYRKYRPLLNFYKGYSDAW